MTKIYHFLGQNVVMELGAREDAKDLVVFKRFYKCPGNVDSRGCYAGFLMISYFSS